MHQDLNTELKNAKTWNEIFAVLDKYYDLNAPMGSMSKAAVLMGLDKALKMTNTKPKDGI